MLALETQCPLRFVLLSCLQHLHNHLEWRVAYRDFTGKEILSPVAPDEMLAVSANQWYVHIFMCHRPIYHIFMSTLTYHVHMTWLWTNFNNFRWWEWRSTRRWIGRQPSHCSWGLDSLKPRIFLSRPLANFLPCLKWQKPLTLSIFLFCLNL